MIYATIDFDGRPIGFFTDDVHESIPAGAIEITDEQWMDCLTYPTQRAFVNGEMVTVPIVPPPARLPDTTPPASVSKLGLIRALREAGTWTSIKAAIAADEDTQEDWDAAQDIRRVDPLVQSMITGLGMTEAQVDALMIRARDIVA